MNCGAYPAAGTSYCWNCGGATSPIAVVCTACGVQLKPIASPEAKSKLVGGLLGIFLGGLGVHRFYLGYNLIGGIQLALFAAGFITCGITMAAASFWGLIEGILIIAGSSITTDAAGMPLRD